MFRIRNPAPHFEVAVRSHSIFGAKSELRTVLKISVFGFAYALMISLGGLLLIGVCAVLQHTALQ